MRKFLCGGALGLVICCGCPHPALAGARVSGTATMIRVDDKDGDPPRPKPKPGHPEGGDDNFKASRPAGDKAGDPPRPHPHPGHPEGGDDN